jgi:hypothetical protein
VVNFLGEAAGEKRDWEQRLRLERGFDVTPHDGTGRMKKSLASITEEDEDESHHKKDPVHECAGEGAAQVLWECQLCGFGWRCWRRW